ncbi:MAG: hypothetical protein KME10_19040 [Plectolyngbya sp. WJT66-NPBG17]|jgi:hypothetical protein|nr:hypothetical protein [Plectolyngbya sp. WJT66-NPBG17]
MNNRLQRKLQRNKVNIALLIIAAIATLTSQDSIRANFSQMGELRSKMQANSSQQMDILADEDHRAELEKIAIARYQGGCKFVVASKDPTTLVSLQDGRPVIDLKTKYPIAAGTIVCDESGNTAEIVKGKPPVASKFAFTGNREVIESAIQRARASNLKRSKTNQ